MGRHYEGLRSMRIDETRDEGDVDYVDYVPTFGACNELPSCQSSMPNSSVLQHHEKNKAYKSVFLQVSTRYCFVRTSVAEVMKK